MQKPSLVNLTEVSVKYLYCLTTSARTLPSREPSVPLRGRNDYQ